jgi:haloalkane dehalogenase
MNDNVHKFVEVLGSQIAYVDVGEGPVVLFQHGNPTSSYIWRDIIAEVAPHARCIAADLIGMGKSEKPEIPYRVEDHVRYFQGFIEALGLDKVVLVLQDWGSALGLDWARRHPERVRGIALMEFIWPIPTWGDVSPKAAEIFRAFRSEQGTRLLIDENRFVEQILPGGIVRQLSAEEMNAYREPFTEPASRKPVYRFPNELPIAGSPVDVWAMAQAYHEWLLETETPKLLFWAEPGSLITPARAKWLAGRLKSCTSVALGAGRHFLQEDHPVKIGNELRNWLPSLG